MKLNIQMKLTIIISLLLIISLSILGGSSFYLSKNFLTASVDDTIATIGSGNAEKIAGDINLFIAKLEGITTHPAIKDGKNIASIVPVLAVETKRLELDNINYIFPDGSAVRANGTKSNVADRAYFKKVVETKRPVISDVITSGTTGKLSVIIAVPVLENGQLKAILGGTLSLDKILYIINDIKYKESGYGFLIDDSGLVISHPKKPVLTGKLNILQKPTNSNSNSVSKDLDEKLINLFKTTLAEGKQVLGQYSSDGAMMSSVATPINIPGGQKWVLVVSMSKAEANANVKNMMQVIITVTLLCLLLSIVISVLISRKFTKPIVRMRDEALLIANGDISERSLSIHSSDELGELSQSLLAMAKQLRSLLVNVKKGTEQVAAASQQLTSSAKQSAQAAEQVATAITDVAQGNETQVKATDKATSIVEHMSASIQQIAASSQNVAHMSDKTANAAQEGSKTIEKAVSQMVHVKNQVNASAQVVTKLGERSKHIGQIVDTISGLASQTNLLALNAAIEAARAGEQGRGFAVVAEEVRKLAEQSQTAAKQIADIISKIQVDTDNAVAAMSEGTQEVSVGAEVVNTAGTAFGEIAKLVDQVSGQVRETAAAIHELASDSQQVVSAVRDIENTSKNAAAHTQTVSAATEEQSATIQEIATSSQSLARMAEELQSNLHKFSL